MRCCAWLERPGLRVLLQRVSSAAVRSDGVETGRIGQGFCLLVGFEAADTEADLQWVVNKVLRLRLFEASDGRMAHDLREVQGEILLVSQFTLHASYRKGTRPSFHRAAPGAIAESWFRRLRELFEQHLGHPVPSGVFGSKMQVSLVNEGPVTLWLDSKNPE